MKDTTVESIGLFIDGGYYAKINEALQKKCSTSIDMTKLMDYIRWEISKMCGKDKPQCHITESHYFRGRYRAYVAEQKNLLYAERKFEDTLIENDVIFHYKHMRKIIDETTKGEKVIEKGIDVWFSLEAYELATIRHFDYVVLITGDADHEMVIRKLKALKIPVILLTWDVEIGGTGTSPMLVEEACKHIEISRLDEVLQKSLCKEIKQ